MHIKQALKKILIEDAGVSAIASTRVYGAKLPQLYVGPSVVFRLNDIGEKLILKEPGMSGLHMKEFRIGCVARDSADAFGYDVAALLDEAVFSILQGYNGVLSDGGSPETRIYIQGANRTHSSDFHDDPTETYWVRSDWEIWHSPAT